MKKWGWPGSLRMRLVLLVFICTLPALVLVAYRAVDDYQAAAARAYNEGQVGTDEVVQRYERIAANTHDLLIALAALPAVNASPESCSRQFAALLKKLPLYANMGVISLDGTVGCSGIPQMHLLSVAHWPWFHEVLQTKRFTRGPLQFGPIVGYNVAVFSLPHFNADGNLDAVLFASVPVSALQPPNSNLLLQHVVITAFAADGKVFARYPPGRQVDTDQSHSPLFLAMRKLAQKSRLTVAGVDGRTRFYSLRSFQTGAAGSVIYLAGGVDRQLVEDRAILPLERDLGVLVSMAAVIMLSAWLLSTLFVRRRVQPLIRALRRISEGDLQTRTGVAGEGGEIGEIARGVDDMAAALDRIERARRQSEQRYREVVEQASDGIFVRRAFGELLYVNDALCRMTGYSRDELLRMRVDELVHQSDADFTSAFQQVNQGQSLLRESSLRHKSGRAIPVEASIRRISGGQVQAIIRDVSERRRLEQTLWENERQLSLIYENVNEVVFYLAVEPDGQFRFVSVNPAFLKATGLTANQVVGKLVQEVIPEPARGMVLQNYKAAVRDRETIRWEETSVYPSGEKHGEVSITPVFDAAGRCTNLIGTVHDITERKRAEVALARQKDLYDMLSQTNQAIVHVTSREELFPKVCRIAVEHGRLLFAWIGLIDETDLRVRAVAHFGMDAGYVEQVRVSVDPSRPEGRGPVGQASRTGQHVVNNDFLKDRATAPWHELAQHAGVRAVAAFPLRLQGKVIGTITLYAGEAGFFTEELLPTLDEMAADVSFALDNFAREAERKNIEEKLAEERRFIDETINSLPGILYVFDDHGRFLLWNRRFETVSGFDADVIRGMQPLQFIAAEHRTLAGQRIAAVFSQGESSVEADFLCRDGTRIPYYFTGRRFAWQGRICLVGMGVDVGARHQTEVELRLSEQRLRLTLEATSIGLWDWDIRADRWYATPTYFRMLGYEPDAEGQNREVWEARAHPDERDLVVNKMAAVRDQGQDSFDIQFRLRHADGSYRWIRSLGKAVEFDQRGRALRMLGLRIDITESKINEQRIAHYMEQLQALSQRMLDIQEQERRSIARELHDQVGAMLTALQMNLHHCEDQVPANLKDMLQDNVAMVSQILAQVRTLSLNLRPSLLDDLGLAAAVRWYLREQVPRDALEVSLDIAEDLPRFSPDCETACFRVLQAAVTNVLRHAGAQHLHIHLRESSGMLALTVRDDGRGFDVAAALAQAAAGTSLGLLAMEERVRLLRGEIVFESDPGKGTEVRVRLPAGADTE